MVAATAKEGILIAAFQQANANGNGDRRGAGGLRPSRHRRGALPAAMLALIALGVSLVPDASLAERPTPVNLQLTPAPGSLSASWEVSSTAGLSGFRIRWRAVGGGGGVEVSRRTRSYTISQLPNVPYEVRVRALYRDTPGPVAIAEATPLAGLDLEEPLDGEPLDEQPSGRDQEEAPGEGSPPEGSTEGEPPEGESPEAQPAQGEEGVSVAEEAPREAGLQEARAQKALVGATPTGPPTPAGGWSVVYADGFGAPIGNGPGQDNTWFPNNCTLTSNCPGFNKDEMEVMNPSAVSETAEGLKLTCTRTTVQMPGKKHYVCGTLRAQTEAKPAGYRYFKWSPGKGQTLVFQAVAKLPPNTGEADPGWWSNGPPWNGTEVDFFEGGGASPEHTTGWSTDPLYTAWFATPHPTATKRGFPVDPSLAFHTYTFEIKPDNTYSIWIDGALQSWATNVGPAKPDLTEKATLILSYALRRCGCTTGFKSGTREFDVKSVSVYEDKAHAGVGVENTGLAPGTTIG
ncbi:MAG: fibronectin type III domain-containing protein [Solirubrobacterales bacterium]